MLDWLPGPLGHRWVEGRRGEHRGVQVTMAVEKAAVDAGAAGDRGDADLESLFGSLIERGDDALSASAAVGLSGGDDAGRVVHESSMDGPGLIGRPMIGMPRSVGRRLRRTAEIAAVMSDCSAGVSWSRLSSTR